MGGPDIIQEAARISQVREIPRPAVNSNQCLLDSAEEAGLGFETEVVFPDTEDAPAGATEGAVDEFITLLIGAEFLSPEGAVVFGFGPMFGRAGR
jgi:hypothetical protein